MQIDLAVDVPQNPNKQANNKLPLCLPLFVLNFPLLMFIQGSLTGSVGTWQRPCPLIRRTRVQFPVPSDLRAGTSIWDNQVRCQLSHTCCTPAKEQEPSVEWGNESLSEVRGIKSIQYILVLDFTLPTSIKRIL